MFGLKTSAKVVFATAAIAFSATAGHAEVLSPGSNTFEKFADAGPWAIYADVNRKSCLIEGLDSNGTAVQMGLTSDHNMGYVGVFVPQNVPLNNNGSEEITILVNGNAYSGTVQPREHGLADGYHGGYFLANNPQFLADLRAGNAMIAFADASGNGVSVDLAGSAAAIDQAAACTSQLASM